MTYTQPDAALGAIPTMPYVARIPASSNCVPQKSEEVFAALATVTAAGASTAASQPSTALPSKTAQASGSGSDAGSTGAGVTLHVSVISILGVVFSAVFLS